MISQHEHEHEIPIVVDDNGDTRVPIDYRSWGRSPRQQDRKISALVASVFRDARHRGAR